MSTENQSTVTEDISFEDIQEGFTFQLPTQEQPSEVEDITKVTLEPTSPPPPPTTEENKEEVKDEKEEVKEPEPPKTENNNFYTNLVKKNIDKGIWEDVIIKDSEEDEGKKLSEMEDLTEEEYLKLVEDQEEIKKQDLNEKFISVEGLPQEKKLILEIVKNGGDLREIFAEPSQMEMPFDEAKGWNLEDEGHQYHIVLQHYMSQGLSENKAKLLADVDRKEFTLDTKAKEIVDYHQTAFMENLKKVNEDLVKEQLAEQENIKKFRSELNKQYKALNIPEASAKKYVDIATRPTENGFVVDTLFEEAMKDPIKAADVIFFLTDPEKFLAEKSKGVKAKTLTETMRTINRIPKDAAKKETRTEEKQESSKFTFELPIK